MRREKIEKLASVVGIRVTLVWLVRLELIEYDKARQLTVPVKTR